MPGPNRPIRAAWPPFRKPRRAKRRRSGFWWIPPVDETEDGPAVSCWADEDIQIAPAGNAGGLPSHLIIPFIYNVQGGFSPAEVAALDAALTPNPLRWRAHPSAERWRCDRIVGDIMFQAQHVTQAGPNACDPTGPMLVNISVQETSTLGDGLVFYDPELNDAALGRRRIHERHLFIAQDSVLCHTCDTDTQSQEGGSTGHVGSAFTTAQRFGVPTSRVVHFDLRPRASIKPEQTLFMVITTSSPCPDTDALFILPKLKCWVSKAL